MRAKTLTVMFDKNINLNKRADKVQKLKLKLLDMEKIVLNDKNLSNNHPVIRLRYLKILISLS